MEVVHSRCGGLDVHKETVVACVRVIEGGKVRQEVRTFSTITKSLYELAEWLLAEQVMAVAMEATGVYWKPVWHVLEASGLSLVLADPPGLCSESRYAERLVCLAREDHPEVGGSFDRKTSGRSFTAS